MFSSENPEMKELVPYYYTIFWFLCMLITISQCNAIGSLRNYGALFRRDDYQPILFLSFFIILFWGFRPVHYLFGDTVVYNDMYRMLQIEGTGIIDVHSDWLFYSFMAFCAPIMDINYFFVIIMCLYVAVMFYGCRKLDFSHGATLMLFCIGAFSFYGYAVNGIRNGVACSFVILAIAGVCKGERVWPIILSFIAIGCHKSAALPLVCMFFTYFVRNPKLMFVVWFGAIGISLVFGDTIADLLTLLNYDDRLVSELKADEADGVEMGHRFRWDFLLYSAMPILLGWYTLFKRGFYNNTYIILLGSYMYANAFWIVAIRAMFSNRIAYLSWFLYPIVLAYPLFNLPIFTKDHSKKVAIILLAHFGFTTIMWLLGK